MTFSKYSKQLYEWFSPSVCLLVCLSVRHTFFAMFPSLHHPEIQELLPITKVMSMQKVKVRGQRSRSERSQPNLTVSGLQLQFEFTYDDEMVHIARRGALLFLKVIRQISRSHGSKNDDKKSTRIWSWRTSINPCPYFSVNLTNLC